MIKLISRSLVPAVVLLGLGVGCLPETFPGEAGVIEFRSNLGPAWDRWAPPRPIGVGAELALTAAQRVDEGSGTSVVPNATPTLDDATGAFSGVATAVDSLTATAAHPGTAHAAFEGEASDAVSLSVVEVARASFVDPLRTAGAKAGLADRVEGDPGPDLTSPIALAAGAELGVSARPEDASGAPLGIHAAGLAFTGSGELTVVQQEFEALITAGAAGTTGTVHAAVTGVERATLDVESVDPAGVVSLLLAVVPDENNSPILKATAQLADGRALWQAPIEWILDERVERYSREELVELMGFSVAGDRNDVVVLRPKKDVTEGFDATVSVRIGDVEATTVVTMHPAPEPVSMGCERTNSVGCGCAAGSTDPLWLLCGLFLLRSLRSSARAQRSGPVRR